jgi:hypothetical protein
MSAPVFVVPFDRSLLKRFRGRTVTVVVSNPDDVDAAVDCCAQGGVTLAGVQYCSGKSLAETIVRESWKGIPLVLVVTEAGRFRDLYPRMAQLRGLSVYVQFASASAENLASARLLSSLGIAVVVPLDRTVQDWELLSDLATYAIAGRLPHAAIEPFARLLNAYRPAAWTDIGAVYFDAPARYLHVDTQGRAALRGADLAASRFAAEDAIAFVDSGAWADAVRPLAQHGERFAAMAPCTTCESWRVCLGRLGPVEGCAAFAAELIELVEQYQQRSARQQALWQH